MHQGSLTIIPGQSRFIQISCLGKLDLHSMNPKVWLTIVSGIVASNEPVIGDMRELTLSLQRTGNRLFEFNGAGLATIGSEIEICQDAWKQPGNLGGDGMGLQQNGKTESVYHQGQFLSDLIVVRSPVTIDSLLGLLGAWRGVNVDR